MPIDQRFNQPHAVGLQPGGFATQQHGMTVAVKASLWPGALLPGRPPPQRGAAQPTR